MIDFSNLPLDKQEFLKPFIENAETVIIEEVFGINNHSYEAYIIKNGEIKLFELE